MKSKARNALVGLASLVAATSMVAPATADRDMPADPAGKEYPCDNYARNVHALASHVQLEPGYALPFKVDIPWPKHRVICVNKTLKDLRYHKGNPDFRASVSQVMTGGVMSHYLVPYALPGQGI